ncbi:hypothetical protein pdam_00007242 [Pocillopora damicornis]|uniref:Uncharacterized protein n=1 Tax=Pocillopora damicornis TaxID=46731 RepID=A0A3M6UND2_POCDA|nr:hypothetical protein pdam_00007242 [Pocillopora damicornis]
MVDSKENYKFDLGVKGLKWAFINDLFHCSSRYESTSFLFKERPQGHFRLSDMPKYVALLFSKLKTTAKMMCPKGTLMLILNVFVIVFVISSQSTADYLLANTACTKVTNGRNILFLGPLILLPKLLRIRRRLGAKPVRVLQLVNI